jgi:hypothetical protein
MAIGSHDCWGCVTSPMWWQSSRSDGHLDSVIAGVEAQHMCDPMPLGRLFSYCCRHQLHNTEAPPGTLGDGILNMNSATTLITSHNTEASPGTLGVMEF